MILGPLVELGTAALQSAIAGARQQNGSTQAASHNGFDDDVDGNAAEPSVASA